MADRARLTLLVPNQAMPVGSMSSARAVVLALGSALRGPIGLQGTSGDKARRHDFAYPNSYAATAPAGTPDTDPAWAIAHITVAADG